MKPSSVAVTIVTYDSEWYIRPCLESVLDQKPAPDEIVVVDNRSADATRRVLVDYKDQVNIVLNGQNAGFCQAQNQAIALTRSEWVLTLNPDVVLQPGFLAGLIEAGRSDPRAGTVCGKLLSMQPDLTLPRRPLLDSTGIYFTPELRHFDRGWGQVDDGRYDRREYVFGASAAAALFRREMIQDALVDGCFFDPDFFAYREDADLAWRAQLLGWRCLYTPDARAYHVRQVRPGARRSAPPVVNMHSVKNRFLMRIKNLTPSVWKRCWWNTLRRDLVVVGGCLLVEQRSLAAFWNLMQCLPKALDHRREIMLRRRAAAESIAAWFGSKNGESLSLPEPLEGLSRQDAEMPRRWPATPGWH